MAIKISHRFLDRLLPTNNIKFIDTIIIGTFNPGIPDLDKLTTQEWQIFEDILGSKKFQKFNQVKNFYDRPQNRFWKIMDVIAHPDFYLNRNLSDKNPHGLKYFAKMDRDTVFKSQQIFCETQGIFITDIVRQIEPKTFDNIYNNFPDTAIENSSCVWNTLGILDVVEKYRPQRILINFSQSRSIPTISQEIGKIQHLYSNITKTVLSTSGAAGYNYETLINHWVPLFN
ncbi:hypothetical protein QQ054_17350 [Oscillatoria amoena NRMC-F 0135]|nr:hypothetical protein [Oscillatoria amoena NRMC-F 0135]